MTLSQVNGIRETRPKKFIVETQVLSTDAHLKDRASSVWAPRS